MADDLYDRDYYAWTQTQAEALRARRSGDNTLDYENLAEEVETLGRSERRACESQIENILAHLLLIEHVGGEAVAHWRHEVVGFRLELEADLTPTLSAALPRELDRLYDRALRRVSSKPGLTPVTAFPQACPYGWDDVVGRGADWIPTPRSEEA